MADSRLPPALERLARREAGRPAAHRRRRRVPPGGLLCERDRSTSAGSQRWARATAGAWCRPPHVGQAQPMEDRAQLGRQGRRGGRGSSAEVRPGGGARLDAEGLVERRRAPGRAARPARWSRIEGRSPSAKRPAAGRSLGGECNLDPLASDERGKLDRAGHLGADPDRPRRGRLDEPGLRAQSDQQEGPLRRIDRSRSGWSGCPRPAG